MTHRPDLSLLLLFLLSVGSLVASDTSSDPPATSGPSPGQDGDPKAAEAKSPDSHATPATTSRSSQSTNSLHSRGNETSENQTVTTGTERSSTERRPEGTESPSDGHEHTRPPVTNRVTNRVTQTGRALPTSSTGYGNGSDRVNTTANAIQTTTGGPFGPKTTGRSATRNATRVAVAVTSSATTKPTRSPNAKGRDNEHTCSTDAPMQEGLVGRCLLVITVLAGIATVFVVSTIILATKLAGSRYRHRARLLQETEMVCISAFLNDTDHPVPKPRHPKSNGALIPSGEDEDGDDLTLNSFLPETDITV